jgi:hypothetical protein
MTGDFNQNSGWARSVDAPGDHGADAGPVVPNVKAQQRGPPARVGRCALFGRIGKLVICGQCVEALQLLDNE